MQIFIIPVGIFSSVFVGDPVVFRHSSLSEWHFSEDDNCTPDLLTITYFLLTLNLKHRNTSNYQRITSNSVALNTYQSINERRYYSWCVSWCLSWVLSLDLHCSLRLPLGTCGCWALEMSQVQSEVHCRYYIHTRFQNLSTEKCKTGHQPFLYWLHVEMTIFGYDRLNKIY